jgi:hypothetical protein
MNRITQIYSLTPLTAPLTPLTIRFDPFDDPFDPLNVSC